MALSRLPLSFAQRAFTNFYSHGQGFAVVSLLALVPLLATVFVCTGAALYALKRKSLAQSICVQQAARLQEDLKSPLRKLLSMNRRAEFLRGKRQTADNNLRAANASGYPPAIAAAQAAQLAVILEQTEFHLRQLALLAEANRIRSVRGREIHERAARVHAIDVVSRTYFPQALAVEAKPPYDLSPNYETVPGFELAQQQRFQYRLDVLDLFPRSRKVVTDLIQKIDCSVTLVERSGDWEIEILTARAL